MSSLTWQDFERLCLRLAHLEGEATHWQLYGRTGEKQGGIDIFVRDASLKYRVWQAKRYQLLKKPGIRAGIKNAVDLFLAGDWADRSERFILATSVSLEGTDYTDLIEDAAARLSARGIQFEPRDVARLSEALKDKPALVDDFFGRAWAEAFCGEAAVASLGERLPRAAFADLRRRLHVHYGAHVASIDPGILRASSAIAGQPLPLPLVQRFVPPDLLVASERRMESEAQVERPVVAREDGRIDDSRTREPRRAENGPVIQRQSLQTWTGVVERAVIIAPPGAGKTTLLRYLALDFLGEDARLPALRRRYPDHIPLILSFAFWTRLLQGRTPGAVTSIPGALTAWFETHGEAELADLVRRAFVDDRVILLIDGIDEWTNETAAASALTILQTFLATHDIPTLITSRPHGETQFRTFDPRFQRTTLAPFSPEQQTAFAETWFRHLAVQDGLALDGSATRATRFVAELQRSADIARLAEVPLLLAGLLALAREGASLPRNRFQAYRELTARLLDAQPTARDKASLATSPRADLDSPTREAVFSTLAFALQEDRSVDAGLDGIDKRAAHGITKAALMRQLDLDAGAAHARAIDMLHVGTDTLGLLVEASSSQIAFLHRAFQEYCAAQYIAALDLDAQRSLMIAHAGDPQWSEVLLFAVQSALRPADVDSLVDAIEEALVDSPGTPVRRRLLADIAFAEVRRSPALTRRLCMALFAFVETGDDLDERAAIVARIVSGLAAEQTRLLVEPHLKRWFPDRHRHALHDALDLIDEWDEPDVDDIVWRNLQADTQEARRQAASTLAKRHGGKPEWLARLCDLLQRPSTIDCVAAATEALFLGWPDESITGRIVDEAASSNVRDLAIAGIRGRVAAGRPADSDRDRLLDWIDEDSWRHETDLETLVGSGWSGDPTVKAYVLERLAEKSFRAGSTVALAVAAFPHDDAVADAVAAHIREARSLIDYHASWETIASAFAGDARVAHALLEQEGAAPDRPYALYHAAQIARTERIRAELLHSLKTPSPLLFWTIDALRTFWPDDPDSNTALRSLLGLPPEAQIRFAQHLPAIEADRPATVARLMHMLSAVRPDRLHAHLHHVIDGLRALDAFSADPTLVDRILTAVGDLEKAGDQTRPFIVLSLLQAAPDHPAVQDAAARELGRPTGSIGVLSLLQRKDPAFRRLILDAAAPLPTVLRRALAIALRQHASSNDAAMSLLEAGTHDAERGIAIDCILAAAEAHQARGTLNEGFLDFLAAEMRAPGIMAEPNRLAALVALASIGEEERAITGLASRSDDRDVRISNWATHDNDLFHAHVADHWAAIDRIRTRAGDKSFLTISDHELVGGLRAYVAGRPDVERAVTHAARRLLTLSPPPVAALAVLAERGEALPDVLDHALAALDRMGGDASWRTTEEALDAAQLVGRHFAQSDRAYSALVARLAGPCKVGALAALCQGWPDCGPLRTEHSLLVGLPEAELAWIPLPLALNILAICSTHEHVLKTLIQAAANMRGDLWDGVPYWRDAMRNRIRRDADLAAAMIAHLNGDPTPAEKVSFLSFLVSALGARADLAAWCTVELKHTDQTTLAQAGMDLWLGRPVLVWKRLSDLIAPSPPSDYSAK